MSVPDDEVCEATARKAPFDHERLAVLEREGRPEVRLIDGPLTRFARPARRRSEAIRLPRCEIDRRAVPAVVEREPADEVLDPADPARERGIVAADGRRERGPSARRHVVFRGAGDRLDLDRDREPAIDGLVPLEIMSRHDRARVRRERKPGLRPRPGKHARDQRVAAVGRDPELRIVQARDDTARRIARVEAAAAFDAEGGIDGALGAAADPPGEGRIDRRRLVDRVRVVAVEATAGRHRRPELGPAGIGFEGEVEAAAEQMQQEPDAARDLRGIVDAAVGGEVATIDLGQRPEQRVQRATALGALVPAHATRSTRPVPPSTRMRSPVRRRRVPSDVLMTQGMPSSRATIAPWESGPPMSITTPPASMK